MNFYWSVNSLPELCNVPPHLRHQIVNKAIAEMHFSFLRSMAIVGSVLTFGAASITVLMTVPAPFAEVLLLLLLKPMSCIFVRPLLLNLARSHLSAITTDLS
jgi:hypothetical protein